MNSFLDKYEKTSWADISSRIELSTRDDVENALKTDGRCGLEGFAALLSPIAGIEYLEEMAQVAHKLTVQRFGKVIRLFAPMYLSNECTNVCDYCGFSLGNKIPRKTLSIAEILKETGALRKHGFEHVLLVTGESAQKVSTDYLFEAITVLSEYFSNVSMEVQPLDQGD